MPIAVGTHARLNNALSTCVVDLVNHGYAALGAAIYVVDKSAAYVAPICSVNLQPQWSDTDKYRETIHRTKLKGGKSAAADFAFSGAGRICSNDKSRRFQNHHVSHIAMGECAILQIVFDGQPVDLSGMVIPEYSNLTAQMQELNTYKDRQYLSWNDIFGLKNDTMDYSVLAMDMNGFTGYEMAVRLDLEARITDCASSVADDYGFEAFQSLGDEIRFRKQGIVELDEVRHLYKAFGVAMNKGASGPILFRGAYDYGAMDESFIGQYNNIAAPIGFRGDVLTRIGNGLKTMPRGRFLYNGIGHYNLDT